MNKVKIEAICDELSDLVNCVNSCREDLEAIEDRLWQLMIKLPDMMETNTADNEGGEDE